MNTEHKSNTPTEIRDLWMTPKFVFDYFKNRFEFNLDLAASKHNSLCGNFINEEEDALSVDVVDERIKDYLVRAVWCNPPYSDIGPWVSLCSNISIDHGVPVVMLIPADTSVKWFKKAFENCSECHFISGRLSFINEETKKPVNGNNKGSVVFVFDSKSPVKQYVTLIDRDSMK